MGKVPVGGASKEANLTSSADTGVKNKPALDKKDINGNLFSEAETATPPPVKKESKNTSIQESKAKAAAPKDSDDNLELLKSMLIAGSAQIPPALARAIAEDKILMKYLANFETEGWKLHYTQGNKQSDHHKISFDVVGNSICFSVSTPGKYTHEFIKEFTGAFRKLLEDNGAKHTNNQGGAQEILAKIPANKGDDKTEGPLDNEESVSGKEHTDGIPYAKVVTKKVLGRSELTPVTHQVLWEKVIIEKEKSGSDSSSRKSDVGA